MRTKEAILKEYFGYDTFRPLQTDIIDTVLSGNDAMVLMPTGGGKSLCYQVPAMVLDGMCIVISPLIALMKDQVQALRANGIPSAFINSTLSSSEQSELERQCLEGKMKLLYIAPEKLFSGGFIDFVKRLNIGLIAIDEAHCISFWGHDFRPEYAQLKVLKTHFPNIPIIALTATADKVTRKDILSQLGIEKAQTFISSFDRPNLSLTVLPGRKRVESIVYFLEKHKNQAGIIYCLSRKTTEDLAEKLQKSGFKAKHYHAGMDSNYRSTVQDEFIKDDIQIICATIAFGMGIDKSNVRWVVHYNLPKNIESFYQEIGRAGRDGLPGDTVLFYSYSDVAMQMDMLRELPPDRKELQAAKLERMKQYAEADICRRRILISYFNETVEKDCGNCDVCKNPRVKTDATLLAQKALSAIARTDEKIAMTMLIDVLRGSHNQTLLEKGYDKLKTFGAGRELKSDEWAHYISQMLNSGIVDIAYDEAHAFRLNNTSWQVLKENKKVTLTKYEPFYAKQEKPLDLPPTKTKKEVLSDDLFERLRKVRKELADSQNVPAYVIFSDKTLTEMAMDKPVNEIDLLNISGVGHQKFNMYGDYFLKEIIAFVKEKSAEGAKIDGATYFLTHELYKKGYGIEEMAQERNLNPVTIISHLAKLYADGHDIDLKKYVTDTEEKVIRQALKELGVGKGSALKPVFEHLQEKYEYYKIRIVCAMVEKK